MRREDEIEKIERFVKEHGVRKGPPAFVGVVAGALPLAEERRRVEALQAAPELSREQRLEMWRRSSWCGRPRRRGRPRSGKDDPI